MSVQGGFGEHAVQQLQQYLEALVLCFCASIGRLAICIQTANVANADAVGIVTEGVRTYLGDASPQLDCAIQQDNEMVAATVPTARLVPALDVSYIEMLACLGGRAMQDDLIYFSHDASDSSVSRW